MVGPIQGFNRVSAYKPQPKFAASNFWGDGGIHWTYTTRPAFSPEVTEKMNTLIDQGVADSQLGLLSLGLNALLTICDPKYAGKDLRFWLDKTEEGKPVIKYSVREKPLTTYTPWMPRVIQGGKKD